jgi:hypothetical protein
VHRRLIKKNDLKKKSGVMLLETYPLHMRLLLPINSHLSLSDRGDSFCVVIVCWTSGMRREICGSVVNGGEEEKEEGGDVQS